MWRFDRICGFVWVSLLAACAQDPAHKASQQSADAQLNAAQRRVIGRHMRTCWIATEQASGGLYGDSEGMRPAPDVLLDVTTDATGTVRKSVVAPENKSDMSNTAYAKFVARAIAATLDQACATLPLPAKLLGQEQTFVMEVAE